MIEHMPNGTVEMPLSFEEKVNAEPSLSARVAQSGAWLLGLNMFRRMLEFGRTIILARLLVPADFGLVAIAGLALSATEAFTETGFQAALIQNKHATTQYLNTAWIVSVFRGLILTGTLIMAAPLVGAFFGNNLVTPVLQVSAVSLALSGFTNIGIIAFQKELQLKKLVWLEFASTLVSLVVSVTLAWLSRNVWAIVVGSLAGAAARMIFSYLMHPFRPKLRFDWRQAKELHAFGKWVFGSSVLWFVVLQGDDLFIGKVLGLTALGFYQLAYRIGNIPATEVSHVISKVTFPAYSKLQDDPKRLREAFLRVVELTGIILFPLVGGIIALADELTCLFLGTKWLPMVPALQILALAGLLRAIGVVAGSVILATGKPALDTRVQLLRFIVLAIAIYPLTKHWGILGTSVAVLSSILVATFFLCTYAMRIIRCPLERFARRLVLPALGAFLMTCSMALLGRCFGVATFSSFVLIGAAGLLAYIAILYALDRILDFGIKSVIADCFASLRA